MKTKVYATYLRVSTQKQGQTQLGLSSQRSMCEGFIKDHNGELAKEFLDIESGTHRNRKGLWDAIEFCNKNHCPLVIATLSRLARDVEFCFKVINTGIEIHFVDMPTINTLLLGVFAAVAQYERELTSERTKKALAVKKARGEKLGASCDRYAATMRDKSKEELEDIARRRGETKKARYLASRDVQAFLKVLRNTFPDACKADEPSAWRWSEINTKAENRVKMLNVMRDYNSLDSTTFSGWQLEDSKEFHHKMAHFIGSIKRNLNYN